MSSIDPTPEGELRTRVLSIHADYQCGKTGVCCSSGWPIPVEPAIEDLQRLAMSEGELRPPVRARGRDPFQPVSGLPHGARVVLRVDPSGRCVFLDPKRGRLCTVHQHLGPRALASACRDFPRVVTLTPAGYSITLSHYCPTAAARLFRDDVTLAIEIDPPLFPPDWPYEGLDARDSVGPLLRPGVMMGWEAHFRWESHAIETLGRADLEPSRAVALLAARAEAARAWTPERGPFEAHLERCVDETPAPAAGERTSAEECVRAWRMVAEAVPPGHPLPPAPDATHSIDLEGSAGPLRRWLAARAFASWLALQGEGLRTSVRGLRLALAVLRAEAGRGRGEGDEGERGVDATVLLEAFRRADLLLVHLADPVALARRLSRSERASGPPPPAW